MFKKILVPVDISNDKTAARTLGVAHDLASDPDCEIHVLSVIPSFGMPMVGSFFPENYKEDMIKVGKKHLAAFLNQQSLSNRVIGHIAEGTIYDEILAAAKEINCDLIVMAAHRPELRDYLLGPNAARVVRHAKQSVFIVRE